MKSGNIWEDFEWPVASDYCWQETSIGLALCVAPGATTLRKYRPLARPSGGMFREFAALEPTPDAILGFARRNGRLGHPVQCLPGTGSRVDPDAFPLGGLAASGFTAMGGPSSLIEPFDREHESGEPVAWGWKSQIVLMAEFMRWLRSGTERRGASLEDARKELDTIGRGIEVNSVLAATVAPRLTPTGQGRTFRFRFEPRSLLGAMWLQAAQSAAEGVTFRKCASCGRPIAIARTTGARTDAKFCSDACKSRSYRTRQTRAVELAGKGWTANRIAKKLQTSVATVRGWMK